MSHTSIWRKAGHRTLMHKGYPKMVVRFSNGKGKAKLLCDAKEFADREMAQGRVPEQSIGLLERDAEKCWAELPKAP